MAPGTYIQKPSTIKAMQYTGSNAQDFIEWLGDDPNGPVGGFTIEGDTGLKLTWAAVQWEQEITADTWVLLRYGGLTLELWDDESFQAAWAAQ